MSADEPITIEVTLEAIERRFDAVNPSYFTRTLTDALDAFRWACVFGSRENVVRDLEERLVLMAVSAERPGDRIFAILSLVRLLKNLLRD